MPNVDDLKMRGIHNKNFELYLAQCDVDDLKLWGIHMLMNETVKYPDFDYLKTSDI